MRRAPDRQCTNTLAMLDMHEPAAHGTVTFPDNIDSTPAIAAVWLLCTRCTLRLLARVEVALVLWTALERTPMLGVWK